MNFLYVKAVESYRLTGILRDIHIQTDRQAGRWSIQLAHSSNSHAGTIGYHTSSVGLTVRVSSR